MVMHTLSVLVQDHPGVLARVAGLFSRRAFNIHSLAVGPAELPGVSRMTVVVAAEGPPLEQVVRQLDKLVGVLDITELASGTAVQRELLLVTVAATPKTRGAITDVVERFGAAVADVGGDTVTVEATANPDQLDALLAALSRFGVLELAQSGVVALAKGGRTSAVAHLTAASA